MQTVRITTQNFDGIPCDIYFTGCTGNTDVITGVTLPYDYTTTDYLGYYLIYFPLYEKYCDLSIPCPSPTPTPSITPTNTQTPTVTPTMTVTPTNTETPTPTPSITASQTPTQTPTPSITSSQTPTQTPTQTYTPSMTPTLTPTMTPSGAGGFSPSSLGDLQIWFDASDVSTLTLTTEGTNTYVQEWDSKGLLTYPISAETANRRPLFITTGSTGSTNAVYFQNTGTTREILFNRGTTNMPTTSGFTMFWAGRYAGATPLTGSLPINPVPITMWNSNYTALTSGEGLTFGYRQMIDRQPITSGSTTVYNSQYETNYNNNGNYVGTSRYVLNGFSYDYTQNIPTTQPKSTTIYEGTLYKATTQTSGYTSNFSTQGKNLNSFGMMGYKLTTTFTQSSTQNQPWEMYEVLVYNKPLSQSDFDQVETYLRDKWGMSYSTSGKAVINTLFSGLTFTATNYNDLVISASTANSGQWYGTWNDNNGKIVLSANTDYRILTEKTTNGAPAWNWDLLDGSNNYITGQTCFDITGTTYLPLNLSAGNYTLSAQTVYDCLDDDSITYLNAVVNAGGSGLTSTISAATSTLFTQLKDNGLYTKMIGMYPFLGENSAGCKFNAVNPTDSNSAYRLTYNGGMTFNSSGETGNGTNGYADSYITSGYTTLIAYSLSTNSSGYDMGREEASNDAYIITKYSANADSYGIVGGNIPVQVSDSPGADGLYIALKESTTLTFYRNGTSIGTNTNSSSLPAQSILIHAATTAGDYSNHTLGFAAVASGITSSQITTLSTIINTFMTSIGRNTY